MSATTSLKLSHELKQRTVIAARDEGLSPHAFMVKAIDQAAANVELRVKFYADAHSARNKLLESDKGYHVDDVHNYLRGKITGKYKKQPEAIPWQK